MFSEAKENTKYSFFFHLVLFSVVNMAPKIPKRLMFIILLVNASFNVSFTVVYLYLQVNKCQCKY